MSQSNISVCISSGIGGILHIGLMVFLLVWIPDKNLKAVFYVISALWGVCDAIWQTQCNSKCSVRATHPRHSSIQAYSHLGSPKGLGSGQGTLSMREVLEIGGCPHVPGNLNPQIGNVGNQSTMTEEGDAALSRAVVMKTRIL